MEKYRIVFQIDGEKEIEGVVVATVQLPVKTNGEGSPSIPVDYYQVVDDENMVHTISPAALVRVVTNKAPIEAFEEAFKEFARLAEKHIKLDSILERFNSNEKFNYHLSINTGKKQLTLVSKESLKREAALKLKKIQDEILAKQNATETVGD